MKSIPFLIVILICTIVIGFGFTDLKKYEDPSKAEASSPSGMAQSAEPFDKMVLVLTHKRCVNCHPAGNQPRQGEDSHFHNFGVTRGADNHGVAALRCQSCHQYENNDYSGVPGAPEWSVAPVKMAWEGLSGVEIVRSMLNPENNGGRSLDELVKHLTEHALVLWAWDPGVNADGVQREVPPVPKDEYIQAVKDWAAAGANIPEN